LHIYTHSNSIAFFELWFVILNNLFNIHYSFLTQKEVTPNNFKFFDFRFLFKMLNLIGGYYFSPNFQSNQLLVALKYWNAGANVDLELDNIAVRGVPIVCSTVYINFIISYCSTLESKYRPVVLNGMKINRLMAYKRLTVYVFQRT
jgi:hypothetical protein